MKREPEIELYNTVNAQINNPGEIDVVQKKNLAYTSYDLEPVRKKDARIQVKGSEIDEYISKFIDNNLENLTSQEFYNFETHMLEGLPVIQEKVRKIGTQFELKNTDFTSDNRFLFLHLVLALNHMNVLDIFSIDFGQPSVHQFEFRIKVQILDSFNNLFNKYQQNIKKHKQYDSDAVELVGQKIIYLEKTHAIHVGDRKCNLPAFSNESDLCAKVFKYNPGVLVDWSEIYIAMSGEDPLDSKRGVARCRKTVKDTIDRINKKVRTKIHTNDELISLKRKTISRNF